MSGPEPVGPGPARPALRNRVRPTADRRRELAHAWRSSTIRSRRGARDKSGDGQAELLAWTDLCHVLINMKEFIFID